MELTAFQTVLISAGVMAMVIFSWVLSKRVKFYRDLAAQNDRLHKIALDHLNQLQVQNIKYKQQLIDANAFLENRPAQCCGRGIHHEEEKGQQAEEEEA